MQRIALLAAALPFMVATANAQTADTPQGRIDPLAANPDSLVRPQRTAVPDRGLEYWTPERMRTAKPTPLPKIDDTPPAGK